MAPFISYRLLHSAIVVTGVLVLVSLMIHLVPGDPAQLMVGDAPVSAAQLRLIRHSLGLDRPLYQQLADDARRFAAGDLGRSLRSSRPIIDDLRAALPSTLSLALAAMAFGLLVGMPAGVLASVRRGGWIDTAVTAFAVVGISLPSFWTGIQLIVVFAIQLGWFPPSGQPGRRGDRHRDRLCARRHRTAGGGRHPSAGFPGRAGRGAFDRGDLHAGESDHGRHVRLARPTDSILVTGAARPPLRQITVWR